MHITKYLIRIIAKLFVSFNNRQSEICNQKAMIIFRRKNATLFSVQPESVSQFGKSWLFDPSFIIPFQQKSSFSFYKSRLPHPRQKFRQPCKPYALFTTLSNFSTQTDNSAIHPELRNYWREEWGKGFRVISSSVTIWLFVIYSGLRSSCVRIPSGPSSPS